MRTLLSILYCFVTILSYSQDIDSELDDDATKKNQVIIKKNLTGVYYEQEDGSLAVIDTTLDLIHLYHPAVENWDQLDIYLGTTGSAWSPGYFNLFRDVGLDVGFHQFDIYEFKSGQLTNYRSKNPFSEINYTLGAGTEQLLDFTHAQQVNDQLSIQIDFRKIAHLGDYQRQRSNHNNMSLLSRYHTPNNRYYLDAGYAFNHIRMEENGGVSDTSIFTADFKNQLNVNLTQSENRWKSNYYRLKHGLNISRKTMSPIPDSTEFADTNFVDTVSIKWVVPQFKFQHEMVYQRKSYKYTDASIDPTYNFYSSLDTNITSTSDSIFVNRLCNTLSLIHQHRKADTSHTLTGQEQLYILHEATTVRQFFNTDTFFRKSQQITNQNVLVGANFFYRSLFDPNLQASFSGAFNITGWNQGDYKANISLDYKLPKKSMKLFFHFAQQLYSPSYIHQNYTGALYAWQNNFSKSFANRYTLGFSNYTWRLRAQVTQALLTNPVLWENGSNAPMQKNQASFTEVKVSKNFTLWKLHLDNIISYQIPAGAILSIPTIWGKHLAYYENRFFDSVLQVQVGAQVRYVNNYTAPLYNPAIGQFYRQTEETIVNYPVIDVFLKLKLKRARIFVMIEHVNQFTFEAGYYAIPNYPMNSRRLVAGVSWVFFN